jgi:hypothetical protein
MPGFFFSGQQRPFSSYDILEDHGPKGVAAMPPSDIYIRESLALNLFFLRIMKEHAFFLQTSFTPKNASMAKTAGYYVSLFGGLLSQGVGMANGALGAEILRSGQFFTPNTLDAEEKTQELTGVPIDSTITVREEALRPGDAAATPELRASTDKLNRDALAATTALAGFKANVLGDVLACRMFTTNYPLVVEHMLGEARLYMSALIRLQGGGGTDGWDIAGREVFWDVNLAQHAKFARGMLDPTEEALIAQANGLAARMDSLAAETAQANPAALAEASARNLEGASDASAFDAAGTEGLLQCKIRSVIPPILSDHNNREANHYIFILKTL